MSEQPERKTKSQYHDTIDLEHSELSDSFAELIAVLNLSLLKIPEDCRDSATWTLNSHTEVEIYYQRPETDAEMATRLERERINQQVKLSQEAEIKAKEIVNLRNLMLKHPEAVTRIMKGYDP